MHPVSTPVHRLNGFFLMFAWSTTDNFLYTLFITTATQPQEPTCKYDTVSIHASN